MPTRLKIDWWNLGRCLLAILVGNTLYYAVWRYLPAVIQHRLYQIDWGLGVDFLVCVGCYGILRWVR